MPLALLARPLPRTALLTSVVALSVSLSLRTSPLPAPALHRAMSSSTRPNAPGWDPVARPFPAARRSDASHTYKSKEKGGDVVVPEPYDWLETPPSQSSETKEWVEKQVAYSAAYIDGFPERAVFKAQLEANFNYARYSCPSAKGDGAFYYSYNSGLDPQSTIYRATAEDVKRPTGDAAGPVGEKWFDQNLLSKDGTVALSATSFSKSGKYFAYGISRSGSDWLSIFVRKTSAPFVTPPADDATARTGGPDRLEDEIRGVKFSAITWLHDDSGFFYQRFPEAKSIGEDGHGKETDRNVDAQLMFHKIGTKQSEDVLVVSKDVKTPESMWSTVVSDDGEWLVLSNSKDTDTKARTYVASLKLQKVSDSMQWIPLSTDFKSELSYLGNDGPTFYFLTNRDASNYKIVKIQVDSSAAQSGHPADLSGDVKTTDLLAEDKDALLSSATIINENKLIVIYMRNVQDEVWQYELKSGRQIKRLLPDLVGTVTQLAGRREDSVAYVSAVSFVNPGIQTKLEWGASAAQSTTATPDETVYRTTLVAGIKPDDFISEQRWVESKDGTKVPMFLVRRKDTPLPAPTWLYFYGGFNIALAPTFSPSLMTWVDLAGGVLAWVNARGGSEFGSQWHEAGRLLNKQNVFDDVLSTCEHLKRERISSTTIVNGGSNGGLGAMAVGNQAEEKHGIGAVVAEVGVHDMLRFSSWTVGAAWCADFGAPIEDPEFFDYNIKYSPLHNVNPDKTYPTVAILSADHDDRVVPAHSFKMVAELQHKLPHNPNPIIARFELNAGHGAGKSTQKRIDEWADKAAIVGRSLGLTYKRKTAAL